jgi:hypothetical protein
MSRYRFFIDILDDACGEMIPPMKAIWPSKEQRKYMAVIEHYNGGGGTQ